MNFLFKTPKFRTKAIEKRINSKGKKREKKNSYKIRWKREGWQNQVMALGKIFKIDKSNQKQQITYKGVSIRLSADFSAETLQAIREWHHIFKVMKGKTYNQEYSTQQGCHSDSMDKSKALRTAKAKRIQHQQTNFTTNPEGTSLGRKETSNLKQLCVYTDCYIKTSWECQTKKLQ